MRLISRILTGVLVALFALPAVLHAGPRKNQPNAGGPGKRIVQYLNLSPQQQSQLRPIVRGARQQVEAVRNDPSLTPDQKRERMKEIRQQTRSQVGQILTPDQQERLNQLRQQQRQQKQQQGQQQVPAQQPSP